MSILVKFFCLSIFDNFLKMKYRLKYNIENLTLFFFKNLSNSRDSLKFGATGFSKINV